MDELDELEKQGYELVDIIAGDVTPKKEIQYLVDKVVSDKRPNFYSDILFDLTSERFPEERAKILWQEILKHKYMMSEKLGRNIGIRVTTLDYLENIKKLIKAPLIISETALLKTIKLSNTDPLTGLFNRRYLLEKLSEMVAEAEASKEKICVFMMDLDGFKKFNDREGHQAGDVILQEFAHSLRENFRSTDFIARYGGDEMVCILPSTDKIVAKTIAQKVCSQIKSTFLETGISLSIGVAEFPSDAHDDSSLISQSDAAMYRAKAYGGNTVSYFHTIELFYKQDDPQPNDVACAGDFNRWNSKKGQMIFDPNEKIWKIQLNLLAGKHKYKFLIGGSNWITDPIETECGDDGFGGMCSLLTVKME